MNATLPCSSQNPEGLLFRSTRSSSGLQCEPSIRAANQKSQKTERQHGVFERGAKILPQRGVSPRIVRRKHKAQHKEQPKTACHPDKNPGNQRQANRKFAVRNKEGDRSRMRKHEVFQYRLHERISALFKKTVNPKLKSAMQSKLRSEDFILSKDQKECADANSQQGKCEGIAIA